jgi:hypothetical protein
MSQKITTGSHHGSMKSGRSGRQIVYVTSDVLDDALSHVRHSDDDTSRTTIKRNRWTKQQESLLVSWAEKASGHSWLHNRCINHYIRRSHYIAIPAGICGYIAGTATLINTGNNAQHDTYISTLIGIFGICAGILSNLQQIFTFKELSEQHKLSALRFQTFFHDISCELSLSPEHRSYPIDFIKMKRLEFDKMIEQSPTIPTSIRELFQRTFENVNVHKPDNMNAIQTIMPFRDAEDANRRESDIMQTGASVFSAPSFLKSGPSTLTGTVGTAGTTTGTTGTASTTVGQAGDLPLKGKMTAASGGGLNRGWTLPVDKISALGSVEVANSFVHTDVESVMSREDFDAPKRALPSATASEQGRGSGKLKRASVLPVIEQPPKQPFRKNFIEFMNAADPTSVRNVKVSTSELEGEM